VYAIRTTTRVLISKYILYRLKFDILNTKRYITRD